MHVTELCWEAKWNEKPGIELKAPGLSHWYSVADNWVTNTGQLPAPQSFIHMHYTSGSPVYTYTAAAMYYTWSHAPPLYKVYT